VSSVNPRAGRSGNLVFALFAFVVYYNLLNLGQNWIATAAQLRRASCCRCTAARFVAGLLWLAKQHNNWTLRAPA
jgi:lipopolysaccharide export system permease protein